MYIHYKCIDSEFDLNLTLGVNFDPSRRGGGGGGMPKAKHVTDRFDHEICRIFYYGQSKGPLGCRRGSDPPSLHKNLAKKAVNE